MTPLHFEEMHQAEWTELEALLNRLLHRRALRVGTPTVAPPDPDVDANTPVSGARVAALYRRACEQLALARARAYPAYIVDRLERMTAEAHQLIYHRREFGLARVKQVITVDFPCTVRAQGRYVAMSAAVFLLPTIIIGLLVYFRPELILSVVSADTAAQFEQMYSPRADSIGRIRTATTDWMMFGFYIRNNVGVAFQCFAGGLLAGLGTLFFLAYNGAYSGAIAGYLTARGLSSTFYSFIATHSSFELTAIVLAGAAGLRIGHAWLAPGRLTRKHSLVLASQESSVILYGITVMLVIAAVFEAFWSSASWLPPAVKYLSAAICWTAVFGYFARQGRRAD
jgi:uncharacterized membrane protein SpoIIM required for sporulation